MKQVPCSVRNYVKRETNPPHFQSISNIPVTMVSGNNVLKLVVHAQRAWESPCSLCSFEVRAAAAPVASILAGRVPASVRLAATFLLW